VIPGTKINVEQLQQALAQLATLKTEGDLLERKLRLKQFPAGTSAIAEQLRFQEIRDSIPAMEAQLKLLLEVAKSLEKLREASFDTSDPTGESS
jgi:hypothetical protein